MFSYTTRRQCPDQWASPSTPTTSPMKWNEMKFYSNYNSINNNFSWLHSLCHNDLVEFPCFHSFLLHSLCCIQLVAFHWMHSLGCIHKVTSICVCIPTLFIYLQQHRKSMCLAGVNGGHCSWVCAIWMLDHLLSPPINTSGHFSARVWFLKNLLNNCLTISGDSKHF